jgi:hypothetical protein
LSETPKERPSLRRNAREAFPPLHAFTNKNVDIGVPALRPTPILFLAPSQGTFMPRIIEVIVLPQGEVTLQTKGYAGSDCLQASKFLEQALGVVTNDQNTTEFYQAETTQQHLKQ